MLQTYFASIDKGQNMFSSKSQVERGIVRSFWDDGLLDVLSGIVVLLIGVAWRFDLVPLSAVAPVVAVPFWRPLRTRITEPRLGHVEFSDRQNTRNQAFLGWSFLIGCMTLILGTSLFLYVFKAERVIPMQDWVAAIPSWAFAILALLTSLVILVRRFVGYASMFVLLGIVVVALELRPEFAMLIGGVFVTVVGILRVVAFVRSHPHQPVQMNGV